MIPAIDDVYTPLEWLAYGGNNLCHWSLVLSGPTGSLEFGNEWIIGQPAIHSVNRLRISARPERVYTGGFQVSLDIGATGLDDVLAAIERTQCVTTGLLRVGPPDESSFRNIALGTVAKVERGLATVTLHFESGYPSAGKPFCRDAANLARYADVPARTFLPQVFGRKGFVLPALFAVETAIASDDVAKTAKSITLTASVDWPPTGRVQINDEVFTYRILSDDGRTLGSDALPLTRPYRRVHDHGSTVVLLPGEELDWCAADHIAEVLETRIDSEKGILNGVGEQVYDDLDGIVATLWRADKLPLAISTSRTPRDGKSPLNVLSWALESETNILDPTDAFAFAAPKRGAVFTTARRILSAQFTDDLLVGADRFDRLDSASLYFEFTDTPNWGAATRLRVTIEKGASSIQFDINRDGVLFPVQMPGRSVLPGSLSAGGTKRIRVGFEHIEAIGAWTNPAAAIDGLFQGTASYSGADPSSLTATFVTDRVEADRAMEVVKLFARVKNGGVSDLTVRLGISIPGKLARDAAFAIAASETEIISLDVTLPSNVASGDLFAPNTVYTISLPGGGDAEMEELWLECTSPKVVNIEAIGAAVSAIPFVVTGEVRLDYNPARIDITPLIPETFRWEFFSVLGGYPKVTIELIDPPALANWAVYLRDLHWEWSVFSATSIRPTARLWGLVDGRRSRPDGTANPALVLHDLVMEPGLGNVAESDANEASFANREELTDERGLAFAAVFMDDIPLGTMIGRALAQSALVLLCEEGRWVLDAAPLDVDGEGSIILPANEWIIGTGTRELEAQSVSDIGSVSIFDGDGAPVFRGAPPPALSVQADWLAAGADSLARFLDTRRFPPRSDLLIRYDARWMAIPAGARLALSGVEQSGRIRQGELAEVHYERGACHALLAYSCETANVFETQVALVQRSERARALRFFLNGRVVAVLDDDGNLFLRGELVEGTLPPGYTTAVLQSQTSPPQLRMNYAGVGSANSAIAFTADGDLLTNVPFLERSAISDSASTAAAEMRTTYSIAGGKDPGGAALRLDLTAIRIRGILKTNQPL